MDDTHKSRRVVAVPFHGSHKTCDDFVYVRPFWLRKIDRSFSCAYAQRGKGKGSKGKNRGKAADSRLKGLSLAWRTPGGSELCFAWNTGDCDGSCERVHQCRVKECYASHQAVNTSKANKRPDRTKV
jgi:hypothetical protein